jgi:hypothetical protein
LEGLIQALRDGASRNRARIRGERGERERRIRAPVGSILIPPPGEDQGKLRWGRDKCA